MASAILLGTPYNQAATARIVEQLYTDSYCHLGPATTKGNEDHAIP